jgi:hypothetical protein
VAKRGILRKQWNTTTGSADVTDAVSESQVLRRHPLSAVQELQTIVQDGSAMISVSLWGLRIQVMKLRLMPHASSATNC